MSMNLGGGGKDSLKADINVTPLVDVMLVLLIIMMLIAPLLQQGVPVTPDNLIPQVQRVLEDKKEKIVYLKGDKDAKYSAIMDAMDAFRKAQIENIALITEKKNKPGGAGGAQ